MNPGIFKRVYVDSSAVGGVFNARVAEQTQPFWDAVERGEVTIILSDVLKNEVDAAPQCVRDFFASLPESQIERVVSTKESDALAERYIAENVVGPTSLDDCKHIVNATRILGYNSVNMKLGYSQINIRTPYEVINDDT